MTKKLLIPFKLLEFQSNFGKRKESIWSDSNRINNFFINRVIHFFLLLINFKSNYLITRIVVINKVQNYDLITKNNTVFFNILNKLLIS